MSETTDAALVGLRERERSLELEAVAIKARVEEVRELIETLERGPRRKPGRPRNVSMVNPVRQDVEMPDRVAGGIAETPVEESVA